MATLAQQQWLYSIKSLAGSKTSCRIDCFLVRRGQNEERQSLQKTSLKIKVTAQPLALLSNPKPFSNHVAT